MEYLDVCDENGQPTGAVVERAAAHRDGILHRTAMVWVIRTRGGKTEVLLQKRSRTRESFPGLYDVSSAGHIPAGAEPLASALRELREELGIDAKPEELACIGRIRCRYEASFGGKPFRDNLFRLAYVYREPVDIDALTLQASEVESVRWFPLEELAAQIRTRPDRFCIAEPELRLLTDHLRNERIEQEN